MSVPIAASAWLSALRLSRLETLRDVDARREHHALARAGRERCERPADRADRPGVASRMRELDVANGAPRDHGVETRGDLLRGFVRRDELEEALPEALARRATHRRRRGLIAERDAMLAVDRHDERVDVLDDAPVQRFRSLESFGERSSLAPESHLLERTLDDREQIPRREGLLHVREGAVSHCGDRRVDGRIAGDEDELRVVRVRLQRRQQIEPRDTVRKSDVDDREVETSADRGFDRGRTVARNRRLAIDRLEELGDVLGEIDVVLDDDRPRHGCRPSDASTDISLSAGNGFSRKTVCSNGAP